MAFFNYTVEDSSPLINYSPADAWTDARNDTSLPSYSGASYHSTTTKDASASFQFNGTGVWIFGAKRPNYGDYSIAVDGTDVVASASAEGSQDQFKQLLGSKLNMSYGTHTITFSISGTSTIDIDFIEVETRLSGNEITKSVMDDTDNRIIYMPSAANWSVNNNKNLFVQDTLHFSQTQGASLSFPFVGESIAIYGTTSPDHADVQIELDGQVMDVLPGGSGGRTSGLHTQVLLFYQDSLDSGQHSLTMTSIERSGTGPFIDLDAVFTYSSNLTGNSSQGGTAPSASGQTPEAHSVPIGVIVGASVGGTFGLLLLLLLLHLLHRRRRTNLEDKESPPPLTPVLPLQQPRMSQIPPRNQMEVLSQASILRPFLTHSRGSSGASSANSSTPMLRSDVPILNAPKPPSHARSASSGSSPVRPTQRPPPLEFPG
ncbi:hypothetical protein VKT23_000761 [Stygiomarasmius scandens]|uniref:Transmembrane protein n=1 Tax=Marasmiellus scandens TaxID=2682957 RepID=A0ABR1K522_9AGAR